jgi:hypothetical protein
VGVLFMQGLHASEMWVAPFCFLTDLLLCFMQAVVTSPLGAPTKSHS